MIERSILKCAYIRSTSQSKLGANREVGRLFIGIRIEDSVKLFKNSYYEKDFGVLPEDDFERFFATDNVT